MEGGEPLQTIIYTQLILLVILWLVYQKMKNQQSKEFLFDLSNISIYWLFIVPLVLCSINVFLLLFLKFEYWYWSFSFLIIPAVTFYIEKMEDNRNIKLTELIRSEIIPIIFEEANRRGIYLEEEDIIATAVRIRKESYVRITISVNEKDKRSKELQQAISLYLNEEHRYSKNKVLLKTKISEKKKFKSNLCY